MLSTRMLRELWSGVKLFAADRRKVDAEIRRAAWEASGRDVRDCWFIRLRNLSDENLLVTRVWFESSPRAEVDRRQRRLPKALAPGEAWRPGSRSRSSPRRCAIAPTSSRASVSRAGP